MYTLNKVAWSIVNPACIGLALLLLSLIFYRVKVLRVGGLVLATLWFWLWGTPLMTAIVGGSLEKAYVVSTDNGEPHMREAGDYPVCDAIVDLGGGTGIHTNFYSGACLNSSADRVYFSALLWKAGKAPIIIPSGENCSLSDGRFLEDLGVPQSAVVMDNEARNTEENAKFVNKMLLQKETNHMPRVLLVTSAWHMKRSLLLFEKYAPRIELIPAPCDFECILSKNSFEFGWLIPSFDKACLNSTYLHEWIGYWWYKYFRS